MFGVVLYLCLILNFSKDKKYQDGRHVGERVFVGCSCVYASDVPLIFNLSTGDISPQFHVVFDDLSQ